IGLALKPGAAPGAATLAQQTEGHAHTPVSGYLASATVSFGQWPTDPPLDRSPNRSPLNRNVHQLVPNEVTIERGGGRELHHRRTPPGNFLWRRNSAN